MKIEEIPPDEIVEMTPIFHRLFNAVGCNPMCHCCKKMLPIGVNFRLGTVEKMNYHYSSGNPRQSMRMIKDEITNSKEVMLCSTCTAETYKYYQEKMFEENKEEFLRREAEHKERGGGCFRVNGKIVH